MGLDMYLTKRTYVGAKYDHRNVEGNINITIDGKPVDIDFKKISTISEEIGYWRKANQIHNWFVNNVQGGVDDCGEYYVQLEKLEELLETCKKVKEISELAEELLPTTLRFFFGDTSYGEYYMEDIDYTIEILTDVLKGNNDTCDIYYGSSW
jgi:hypothetical protein